MVRHKLPWHPTPVTLPTNNVFALLTSLRQITEGGLEAHYARYTHAAHRVREELRRLGFEMFAADDCASPLITAVRPLPGWMCPTCKSTCSASTRS